MLKKIALRDFRGIERLDNVELGTLTVFFGPNGAGKTSVLDAIWLLHECVVNGVEEGLKKRISRHGLIRKGSLRKTLATCVENEGSHYEVEFAENLNGLIPAPGEFLAKIVDPLLWDPQGEQLSNIIRRSVGDAGYLQAKHPEGNDEYYVDLTNGRLGLEDYLYRDISKSDQSSRLLLQTLKNTAYYSSRYFSLIHVKTEASVASSDCRLTDDGRNLWSVLRNLNDRRDIDADKWNPRSRYEAVLHWTRRAFPFFESWGIEGGSSHVFCSAKLKGVRDLVLAAQLADGLIQFTLLMAGLFSEPFGHQLILLDEPDLSLHPWAQFVLAEAIEDATKNWGRQVMMATHSPTLLNAFPEDSLYLMTPQEGRTTIQRVSEMVEPKELLRQYGAGYLYMSQLIGEQSPEQMAEVVDADR